MSNNCERDRREDDRTGQALVLYMLPVIAFCLICGGLAWWAGRRGAPRWAVQLLCFPTVFAISNTVGLVVVGAGSFLFGLLRGTTDALLYRDLTHYLDLTLNVVWGPFLGAVWGIDAPLAAYASGVPWWHIAVFQTAVWFGIGRYVSGALLWLIDWITSPGH